MISIWICLTCKWSTLMHEHRDKRLEICHLKWNKTQKQSFTEKSIKERSSFKRTEFKQYIKVVWEPKSQQTGERFKEFSEIAKTKVKVLNHFKREEKTSSKINQISTKSDNFKAFDHWICLSFGEVKTLRRRHCKNCECCPGRSLPAGH